MKFSIKSKLLFIIFLIIIILCLLNVKVYADDTKFTLSNESIDIELNNTRFLSYSGGSGSVTWASSDTSIATVDNGNITAKKIGTTTITATRGNETASCTVNVVYSSLKIGGNEGKNVSSVNLILGEHSSEKLVAKVEDGNFTEVTNPTVTWKSSDTSVVIVDNSTGTITAVKAGTARITATAAGVSDSCDVTVYDAPAFTDFSNAKYETSLNWTTETLKISGIKPSKDDYAKYHYIITSNNTKPDIIKNSYGSLDIEKMNNTVEMFSINTEENYIYTHNISKYAELNQDLYIWILQDTKLDDMYYDENGKFVSHSTKFVVEGKEIQRAELPKLNLILQSFSIGYWNGSANNEDDNYTHIDFNFPSETDNRKFTIKIGKVSDSTILSKIQNNDYAGITDLLAYAKNNDSIYLKNLTTTSKAYYRSDSALFDGNKLLENKAYYYIYVVFDDENGKYYPIEGVTLGQAWLSSSSDSWNLWAYTSSDFQWDNLSSTPIDTSVKDPTIASGILPNTGVRSIIIVSSILLIILLGIILYTKYNKFKDIN